MLENRYLCDVTCRNRRIVGVVVLKEGVSHLLGQPGHVVLLVALGGRRIHRRGRIRIGRGTKLGGEAGPQDLCFRLSGPDSFEEEIVAEELGRKQDLSVLHILGHIGK